MTQDKAVRTVTSLLPEIEKSGAAKALLTHATNADLPPAQLEKLAQVYNTMRQVSHVDNAADEDRGNTVPLVDVSQTVLDYAGSFAPKVTHRQKAAHSTHRTANVDLMAALNRDLEDKPVALEKAAAAPAEAPVINVSPDEVSDALMRLDIELRSEMSKCAGKLVAQAPRPDSFVLDVAEAEREALYLQPEALVKEAGDWLEKFAGQHHLTIQRHDYDDAIPARAYNIDHDLGMAFAELAEANGTRNEITKMATTGVTEEEIRATQPEQEGSGESIRFMPGGGRAPDASPTAEEMEAAFAQAATVSAPAAGAGAAPDGATPPEKEEDSDKKSEPKDSKKGGDSPESVETDINLKAVGNAAKAPFRAAGNAIQGAAKKTDEVLTRITSKERQNKPQKKLDIDIADVKRTIALKRMIGTDPVLKEADPKDVLDIYNSIAELNPQMAGNLPALRLILREAVSYEGLTLDSQKTITEIGRNQSQGEQLASENDRKRYAVSPSVPAISQTKK